MKLKKLLVFLATITGVITGLYVALKGKIIKPNKEKEGDYNVLSYNIKSVGKDQDRFDQRKLKLVSGIDSINPDIFVLQNADSPWLSLLPSIFTGFTMVGTKTKRVDNSPIFVKKSLFKVIESGDFCLSKKPTKNKRKCKNYATYALLEDKRNNKRFVVYNATIKVLEIKSRIKASAALLEKMKLDKYPIIIAGSLNSFESSNVYKTITANGFSDTKFIAKKTMSYGTYNAMQNLLVKLLSPVDYIFVESSQFNVFDYRVVTSSTYNNRPVSDHYPVVANISPV